MCVCVKGRRRKRSIKFYKQVEDQNFYDREDFVSSELGDDKGGEENFWVIFICFNFLGRSAVIKTRDDFMGILLAKHK